MAAEQDKLWWEDSPLLPFKQNSSICVVGSTGSGKTQWVYKFLRHVKVMFEGQPPQKILYCYGIWQDLYEEMERTVPNLEFHEGLPSASLLDDIAANNSHNMIILDDLMEQMVRSDECEILLTRRCHHNRFSTLYVSQNAYKSGKNARTIALNTWYLVLFNNLRDASQIACLANQMFPGNASYFKEAYSDATSNKYGYLLVDSSPHADLRYRLRTHIFPGEDTIVYLSKKV